MNVFGVNSLAVLASFVIVGHAERESLIDIN